MSAMSDKLKAVSSEFASSEAKGGGFNNPDDGKYVFNVDSATVVENKRSGDPQVQYVFSITEDNDDFVGRKVYQWDNLKNTDKQPDAVGYTKGRLESLGIETGEMDISDLPEVLESLVGAHFEGTLKTSMSGDRAFQNLYCNELVDE